MSRKKQDAEPSQAELLTYEEIKVELARRFPYFVLCTLRQAEGNAGGEEFRVSYAGSPTLALGLIERSMDCMKEIIADGIYENR